MKKVKILIAAVVLIAVSIFLFRNMDHQVSLALFITEFEVNALTLMGMSFFAGVALMILRTLWRSWRADNEKTSKKKQKAM